MHSTDWFPAGYESMSAHGFLQMWYKAGGGKKANAKHFAVDGIWSLRVPALPDGQLAECFKSLAKNKGCSLERFGNCRVLELIKQLFK